MADSSNTSPCKVSYNGALRRFLLTRPASWSEFEYKVRSCFSLPPAFELSIQYRDEEGDIITLSTESELQDVLAMHAIFHQGAPVKFDISVFDPQSQHTGGTATPAAPSISTSVSHSKAPSVAGSSITSPTHPQPLQQPLTAWGLAQLNQESDHESFRSSSVHESLAHEGQDTPLAQYYRQSGVVGGASTNAHYHKRYGSEQSDDVSLIELEDGIEPPSRQEEELTSTRATSPRIAPQLQEQSQSLMDVDQTLTYPMQEIETAMAEIKQTEQQLEHELEQQRASPELTMPYITEPLSRDSTSSVASHHTAFEQHQEDADGSVAMDTAPVSEMDALHLGTATIVEDGEEGATMDSNSKVTKGKGRAMDGDDSIFTTAASTAAETTKSSAALDADPAEPELPPSTSTASTSTSPPERSYDEEDRALFEQFQMLVREFQHVIQNNPQLVALASNILDKIVNHVKVNVESFATYLQHAAQTAQQAASEAAREAQEAAREAHEAARESVRESTRNHTFFGQQASGCPFSDNGDFPFFPHHRSMGRRGGRFGFHHPPPPPPPVPTGPTAAAVPPMPPMPPMPPVPPMPPMPGFFSACSPSTASTTSQPSKPSKPSPFTLGFPFVSPGPKCGGRSPKLRGRPKAQDTEASNVNDGGEGSSSSSSGMPGSFPSQPPMTEVNNSGSGWTWMRLPDDEVKDQHLPPSTRAKFGWVWREGSEKKKVDDEPEADTTTATAMDQDGSEDPVPLYTPVDSADPPATFPFGGRGGFGGARGAWAGFFRGGRSNMHNTFPHRGHHHHYGRHHSSPHSGDEAERKTADDIREASLRRRQTMLEGRQAAMRARQEAEEERKRHHQARVEQLVKKSRPHSHIGTFLFGSSSTSSSPSIAAGNNSASTTTSEAPVMGAGSLSGIWPTGASTTTTTTRTPGEFPVANAYTPVETVPASVPEAPATAVPSTPPRAPTTIDPFQDPFDFENELQTLTSMGFEDSEELRSTLRDFGGEIEAVIDYLLNKQ